MNLSEGKDAIGVKWIYKRKFDNDGNVVKHKARLVAKGFSQEPGIDYNEAFSPVARLDIVRTVLAIAGHHEWKVYPMDVKSSFLNGILQEEVYVQQPSGYQILGHEHKVYILKKDLYGLKQAPRAWYNRIDSYFQSLVFGLDSLTGVPRIMREK